VSRLRHGYTNLTRRLPGARVEKRYEGLGRSERADREHACLVSLAHRLPVPEVVERDPAVPLLIVRHASGLHGQDLVDTGRAAEVLRLLGEALLSLQQVPTWAVPGLVGTGSVIVHGDFGPQNVLIGGDRITALVDWEFAHIGQPVEDLAWAEWIIRMHHPDAADALPALLDASRLGMPWSARHHAMVARCEELMALAAAAGSTGAVALWRDRLRATEQWTE
jgi:Phosphotransferase enzyme family